MNAVSPFVLDAQHWSDHFDRVGIDTPGLGSTIIAWSLDLCPYRLVLAELLRIFERPKRHRAEAYPLAGLHIYSCNAGDLAVTTTQRRIRLDEGEKFDLMWLRRSDSSMLATVPACSGTRPDLDGANHQNPGASSN